MPGMKVLVLAGPESSGKSWLAEHLQQRFGGELVSEYVRHFIEQEQRDTCYADIPVIARGQLAQEDEARSRAPELLILDTHLLSNILWSQTLFGDCPPWLEQALLTRRYDLHLLLSPDGVEWVSDGQRCQPLLSERQAFFDASRAWLDRHGQRYEVIEGSWSYRMERAVEAVEELLGRRAQPRV
ncbi:nicotinamide-nucleotide adenylyltransferase, NadR type [Pseudomonas abietaniphila]|uniref:Nicotinamide-nucleotide adenylyltransferase, NadR type n=2 Tax=Pseudomonas abietaniphila TaxID=89065 RepID=A0A1G8MCT4_9PSED|nr:nicotinamide-nucleotide adenylyltransferase, NadR type [Pseudomonas abietaniphila]